MNDHDADRLAGAMNRLRPDWPVKQLRTLLADDRLTGRPYRDLAVALAWVACDTGSGNPYRVLENGPWWRAVAVDGEERHWRNVAPLGSRCTTCDQVEDECRRRFLPTGDPKRDDVQGRHEFTHPIEQTTDVPRVIEALKAELPATTARTQLHPTHDEESAHA